MAEGKHVIDSLSGSQFHRATTWWAPLSVSFREFSLPPPPPVSPQHLKDTFIETCLGGKAGMTEKLLRLGFGIIVII